jgi:Domain of unknown function (DUF5668)
MVDPVQPAQSIPPVQPAQTGRPICHCAYCRIRSLFGPIMIIAVGVVFLVAQYTRYSFGELWPFLLIVAGILKVAENMAPREGHPTS